MIKLYTNSCLLCFTYFALCDVMDVNTTARRAIDRDDYDSGSNDDVDDVAIDYQSDASTKQSQVECEDFSEELYQKHMEWVSILKRHSTPSHENQDERVVRDFNVSCVILINSVPPPLRQPP